MKDKMLVFLDNEGPCTLNDNAFEITAALAAECGLGEEAGRRFFANMSNIDDLWGDFGLVAKKDPSYSAGHTLKVVLPFFKAMGATSEWLRKFARATLRVVPNIQAVIKELQDKDYGLYQISTSYEYFIQEFCLFAGLDFARARCTFLNGFDEIPLDEAESAFLKDFVLEVAEMSPVHYDPSTGQISPGYQDNYNRLTQVVWGWIWRLPVGDLLRTVRPIGQFQKKEAVQEICQVQNISPKNAMYVGDSQTDVQAINWIRENGGLTMMFNGKGQVCGRSDLMYIGQDARAILEVAELLASEGKDAAIKYYSLGREADCGNGIIATVTPDNLDSLHSASVAMRKEFRGVHIGSLT